MTVCGKFITHLPNPSGQMIEVSTSYPCIIDDPKGRDHDGPHMAMEIPRSVTAREHWERGRAAALADQRHAASGLGQFQGRAQTATERLVDPDLHTSAPHPSQTVLCPYCDHRPMAKDLYRHLAEAHSSSAAPRRPSEAPRAALAREDAAHPLIVLEAPEEAIEVPPAPSRAERSHSQPLPRANDRKGTHEILIDHVQSRLDIGLERYGNKLQPFNGRDASRDLLEELTDAAVYLIQFQIERAEMLGHLQRLAKALETRPFVSMTDNTVAEETVAKLMDWLGGPSL